MPQIKCLTSDLPGSLLRRRTRMKLSSYLDVTSRRVLPSGLTCDWRGLADLMGLSNLDIQGLEGRDEPTIELLNRWDHQQGATVEALVGYINQLERRDVMEDIQAFIEEDIEEYNKKYRPVQDNTVSGRLVGEIGPSEPLTVDDDQEVTQQYQAYVCVSDQDIEFALEHLIPRLESEPHKLKLFLELRDMRCGVWESNASAHLMAQRCKKIIIILSPQFLSDPKCEWILQYAHSLSTESRTRLLIPLMIADCVVPNVLRGLNVIKLTRYTDPKLKEVLEWQWVRLAKTLGV